MLLNDEDATAFAAFETATRSELAPAGEFQSDLVERIVTAAWRARRADGLEAALFGRYLADTRSTDPGSGQDALGLGLIRDGNGPRALDTLVRYRGSVLAELFRALGALKMLQVRSQDSDAGVALLPPPRNETNPRKLPNTNS